MLLGQGVIQRGLIDNTKQQFLWFVYKHMHKCACTCACVHLRQQLTLWKDVKRIKSHTQRDLGDADLMLYMGYGGGDGGGVAYNPVVCGRNNESKLSVCFFSNRGWSPKFATRLNIIITNALYSIFWQDWITNDLYNSFQYFKHSKILICRMNLSFQIVKHLNGNIQVFDYNF